MYNDIIENGAIAQTVIRIAPAADSHALVLLESMSYPSLIP
jgi:hypothetical protein